MKFYKLCRRKKMKKKLLLVTGAGASASMDLGFPLNKGIML
jgi:hypothetical protein